VDALGLGRLALFQPKAGSKQMLSDGLPGNFFDSYKERKILFK
jgi:hypothetical protein